MRKIVSIIMVVAMLAATALPASAQVAYEGYSYNAWKTSVPAPTGYMPDEYYTGYSLGVGDFSNPQDFYIGPDDVMYITDTGNNRIVMFDADMNHLGDITSFTYNGEEVTFNKPEGMFVHKNGSIYVADAGNQRVVIANPDYTVRAIITKPVDSDVYEQNDELIPIRVFADDAGIVYILSRSNNKGILTFDEKGTFLSYYGAAKVQVTAEVLAQSFWEKLWSEEQADAAVSNTPTEYKSIHISDDGFIYATQLVSSWNNRNQIKKLNPKGVNIAKQRRRYYADLGNSDLILGDAEARIVGSGRIGNNFTDTVTNDDSTMLFMLDSARQKIFAYDNDFNFLYVFGSSGSTNGQQLGTFLTAAAVEVRGTTVYVLDSEDASITSFKQTTFGELVQTGINLYNLGEFEAAIEPWTEVLKLDSNYDVAYISLSRAAYEAGDFEKALEYAKLAYDRDSYENAYLEVRSAFLKENFDIIFIIIAVIVVFLIALPAITKRRKNKKVGGSK